MARTRAGWCAARWLRRRAAPGSRRQPCHLVWACALSTTVKQSWRYRACSRGSLSSRSCCGATSRLSACRRVSRGRWVCSVPRRRRARPRVVVCRCPPAPQRGSAWRHGVAAPQRRPQTPAILVLRDVDVACVLTVPVSSKVPSRSKMTIAGGGWASPIRVSMLGAVNCNGNYATGGAGGCVSKHTRPRVGSSLEYIQLSLLTDPP